MSNKLVDILAPKIVGPEGPYRCIYLDPPWPERGGGKSKRGADRHYDTLTVRQIEKVVLDALQVYADPHAQDGVSVQAHARVGEDVAREHREMGETGRRACKRAVRPQPRPRDRPSDHIPHRAMPDITRSIDIARAFRRFAIKDLAAVK